MDPSGSGRPVGLLGLHSQTTAAVRAAARRPAGQPSQRLRTRATRPFPAAPSSATCRCPPCVPRLRQPRYQRTRIRPRNVSGTRKTPSRASRAAWGKGRLPGPIGRFECARCPRHSAQHGAASRRKRCPVAGQYRRHDQRQCGPGLGLVGAKTRGPISFGQLKAPSANRPESCAPRPARLFVWLRTEPIKFGVAKGQPG